MNYAQIISHYGTQVEAARRLGISQPAISAWANGRAIPTDAQIAIEIETKGKLRADLPAFVRKQAA